MSGICDTCRREHCHAKMDGLKSCDFHEGGETRYEKLFGTPEMAARTLYESTSECRCCVIRDDCGYDLDKCVMYDRDKLLEWLRGDA